MVEIIPAILPKSFKELEQGLQTLRGITSLVQIDVVSDIFMGQESMPLWEDFDFEFDLFVEPAPFVPRALTLGASRVVIHSRHASASEALQGLQATRGGEYPTAVGVALRPTDTPESLRPFEGLYDFVQVMGIDHEAEQGQQFDPRAIALLRALRAAHPTLPLQVDGHAASHERELVQAGASRLIVGSAILQAEDPHAAYKQIYTRANAQ